MVDDDIELRMIEVASVLVAAITVSADISAVMATQTRIARMGTAVTRSSPTGMILRFIVADARHQRHGQLRMPTELDIADVLTMTKFYACFLVETRLRDSHLILVSSAFTVNAMLTILLLGGIRLVGLSAIWLRLTFVTGAISSQLLP